MTSPTPGINIIPDGPTLYIISQLKGKDLCNVAQVSHRFNTLTEQHRECIYSQENFDTVIDKFIDADNFSTTISLIWWLVRHHPERKCSSDVIDWASRTGHTKIIRLLLEANKLFTDSALDWASDNGHIKVVRLLLETPLFRSAGTHWALNCASKNGHLEIVKLLVAANKPCTAYALNRASKRGFTKIVKFLLEAGSPYSDCTHWALDWASESGHTEIVKLLVAANKSCSIGALDWASANGHTEIARLLST